MMEYINYIKDHNLGEIFENTSFKEVTTLGIGGNICLLYYPNSIKNFLTFYDFYINNTNNKLFPLFILGNGSNVLASDKPFVGIVVCLKKIDIQYILIGNNLIASSGVLISSLIYSLAKKGYGGMEYLSGIPATIGGLVTMNAGAYGKEISDNFIEAWCLNKDGNIINIKKDNMDFKYRKSIIQKEHLIVLYASFILEAKNEKEILLEVNKKIKNRKEKQPLKEKNGGCTFKNIVPFSTWQMIDSVGCRGYRIGDAQVSNKHANFLINLGNATSNDMLLLIKHIQNEVKK